MLTRKPFMDALAGRHAAVVVPAMVRNPSEALVFVTKAKAYAGSVDVIEWRVDAAVAAAKLLGRDANLAGIAQTLSSAGLPILATVRTNREGGSYDASNIIEYERLIISLADLGVAAVDVELWAVRGRLLHILRASGAKIVLSAHDWSGTPSRAALREKFRRMYELGADVAKIAVTPRLFADVKAIAGEVMRAAYELDIPVIGIPMGETGRVVRLQPEAFDCAATFAVLTEASAPGQCSVAEIEYRRKL